METTERRAFAVLGVCFFLSGATGLVYQVVWLRLLGLVLGHTVYAITTVLAAFMAGLALGSFVFARWAGRFRNLVGVYGWLEIGIGVYCALLPALLWLGSGVYLRLHQALGLSYQAFSLVQFAVVFVLLLLPTTLMGGTLPVLSQALAGRQGAFGRIVGALYAVNTFGAVTGVALAGYVLLPALGNRTTIAVAAAANLIVGALALAYGRSRRGAEASRSDQPAPAPAHGTPGGAPEAPGLAVWLTVAALGVSGAVSMFYEVAWTRALALVIGSSTYAFTSMLVAVLLGIAGGSALYSWLWGARRASPATFAVLQAGIGVATGAVVLLFERFPDLFLAALRHSDSPGFVQTIQVGVSITALLPSTLLIGATFPCAVAVAARAAARVGRDVGQVYAVNTLGAIVGVMVAGFALMPALGAHTTLKVGILANLGLAAALLAASRGPAMAWRLGGLGAVAAAAAGVVLIQPWDPRVMSGGVAIYAKSYLRAAKGQRVAEIVKAERTELLFYRDGLSATVSVHREGANTVLRVNGKADASTTVDMPTQIMLGQLPMLVHPNPRRVLVIGLGSGVTAGAVARHPIERLDLVEIEPAVVEASRFFAAEHGEVLQDARVRTIVADGRNFLLTTPERYDVIISEPSNPWVGGLASLFSIEFFELARQRLRPGGIVLQWLQGYNLHPEDFRMVLGTFRAVFPATSVWNPVRGDFLLLGRAEAAPLSLGVMRARYQATPAIGTALKRYGIEDWGGVLGYFMLGESDTARLTDGAALNTDDRLPLEFSAPRALYVSTVERNLTLVRSFRAAELPAVTPDGAREVETAEVQYWIGRACLARSAPDDALRHFTRALRLDPGHTRALFGAATVQLALGHPAEALELARRAIDREPSNANALLTAGVASIALEAPRQALLFLERAHAFDPQKPEIQRALRRARDLAAGAGPFGGAQDSEEDAGAGSRIGSTTIGQ